MSLMKQLQFEITRLARKETKAQLEPIKRVNASQRGYIAELRREISELQREVAHLKKVNGTPTQTTVEKPEKGFWITSKGIISMRKKFGLNQSDFAKLIGVSIPSIVKWEKHQGSIPFRSKKTADRIQVVRGMTKKDAWAELGKEKAPAKASAAE